MAKDCSRVVLCVVLALLAALPGLSSAEIEAVVPRDGRVALDVPLAPAGFGVDSAEIDHPYLQLSPGDMLSWSGYGYLSGDLHLLSAAAIELVDGVQCLRVADEFFSRMEANDGSPHSWRELWLAQDLEGNVWTLRLADSDGVDVTYGAATPSPALWTDLVVGDAWTYTVPGEAWPYVGSGTGVVVSTTASVGPLRMGGGPYVGCLHVRDVAPDDLTAEKYYAPGVGLVRIAYPNPVGEAGFERVFLLRPQPGYGVLEFGTTSYATVEEAGTFPVTLVRTGGSSSVVAVEFQVSAGSVTFAGEGTFDWVDWKVLHLAPGQTGLVFDVAVQDNSVWNHQHSLEIQLSNPAPEGGPILGALTTAIVSVDEAEEGEDPGYFIGPCFIDSLLL